MRFLGAVVLILWLARALAGGEFLHVDYAVHPAFTGGEYVDGGRPETFANMPGEWCEPMPVGAAHPRRRSSAIDRVRLPQRA